MMSKQGKWQYVTNIATSIGWGSFIAIMIQLLTDVVFGNDDIIGMLIFSAICGASTIVYYSDKLPMAAKLTIQFVVSIATYIIVAIKQQWFRGSMAKGIIIGGAIFTVMFFIIWLFINYSIKKQVESVNKSLGDKDDSK